jgi:PAS domain S-box-containing protein
MTALSVPQITVAGRDRRLRALLVLGWGIAVASIVAVCAIAVRHAWIEADARGRASATFVAVAAHKAVHGVFETARVVLDSVGELALLTDSLNDPTAAFDARLDEIQASVPDIVGIVLQDARGTIRAAAAPRYGVGRDLGELDYFRRLAADPQRRYEVGAPFQSTFFNDQMIPLARAIRAPDGTLLAVVAVGIRVRSVVGAISPSLGDMAAASLWRQDRLQLATGGRMDDDDVILWTAQAGIDVDGFSHALPDGTQRFAASRNNAQFPFFVSVSLDAAPYRSQAWRVTALAGALCGLGFAVLAALAIVQGRRIAEKDKARADLGVRERRFRHLVETVPGIVIQWRRDARGYGLTWVSPRSLDILGIRAEDLVRDPRHLRIHPDDRVRWFEAFAGITGEEGLWSFSGRFIPPDGTVRDCVIKAWTARDTDGSIVGDGVLLDVTEEMRIRETASETMARLSALFETADDAIATIDDDGRVIDFNPAAERMFGWPRADILGRPHDGLVSAIEAEPAGLSDDPEHDRAAYEQVVGSDAKPGWRLREGRRRDGTIFPVALSFGRFDANGREYGVAIARDMTDIVEAEARLKQANAKLERLLRAAEDANLSKSRFLSNMSHELRTPLNAVIGFADLMAEASFGPHSHPKYAEYARDITDAGRHLLALVNDVLDLSRIADGNLDLAPARVDARRALVRAVRAIWPSIRKTGQRLRVRAARDVRPVLVDPTALHQILLNVLSNAVKYTPPGGRIFLRLGGDVQGFVEIRVEDDGPGIRREILEQIGRPFVRADDAYTSSRSGVGLGLAISVGLARASGGDLLIESREGEGTTAILLLPAAVSMTALLRMPA